jgi:hypothetical protein
MGSISAHRSRAPRGLHISSSPSASLQSLCIRSVRDRELVQVGYEHAVIRVSTAPSSGPPRLTTMVLTWNQCL